MLKGSLKQLGKSFDVEILKLDFDHNKVTKDNLLEINDEMILYLNNDIVSLYLILIKYNIEVYNITGLNITRFKTVSSLAINTYLSEPPDRGIIKNILILEI